MFRSFTQIACVAFFLSACNGDDPPFAGAFELSIETFNPGDLEISEITVEPTELIAIWSETIDGETEKVVLATDVDLLVLPVSETPYIQSFGVIPAPIGFIHQIRIVTPDGETRTVIDPDGKPLTIPSGEQSGIKVDPEDGIPFEIVESGVTGVRIMLDADRQIHAPGCGFDRVNKRCRANGAQREKRPKKVTPSGNSVPPAYHFKPHLFARQTYASVQLYPQFADDELYVMFESGTTRARAEALAIDLSASIIRESSFGPWFTYQLPGDSDEFLVSTNVETEPDVLVASPNFFVHALNAKPSELDAVPVEPYWLENISAYEAWDITKGTQQPLVAVIDSSISVRNLEYQENLNLNIGELPVLLTKDRNCFDIGDIEILPSADDDGDGFADGDTNEDGVIDSTDYDINNDGGVTLVDLNTEPILTFVNQAVGAPTELRTMSFFFTRSTTTCGLFEDQTDGTDENSLVDDILGWDFVEENNDVFASADSTLPASASTHGTQVIGTLASVINEDSIFAGTFDENLTNHVGVAPVTRILPIRVILSSRDDFEDLIGEPVDSLPADNIRRDQINDALAYAVELGADVINGSWSELCGPDGKDGIPIQNQCSPELVAQKAEKAERMFEVIGLENTLYIAAGINVGVADLDRGDVQDLPTELDLDYIVAIHPSDSEDRSAMRDDGGRLSSFGPGTFDLAAPGKDIQLITLGSRTTGGLMENDGYDSEVGSGSSLAAPLVSGAASLVLSVCPSLRGRPVDLKQILLDNADCGLSGLNDAVASGCRLNVKGAIDAVTTGGACP